MKQENENNGNRAADASQTRVGFVRPEERPVAPGLAGSNFNPNQPVATESGVVPNGSMPKDQRVRHILK